MTILEKLANLREKFQSLPPEWAKLYATGIKLKEHVNSQRIAGFIHISGMPSNRNNGDNRIFHPDIETAQVGALNGMIFQNYATFASALALLEATPEYQEACKAVAPMHAELVELEAQLEQERIVEQERQAALQNAVLRAPCPPRGACKG